jgi:hypothetical protein
VSQSRRHSLIEAWVNVLIGYWVAVAGNCVIFPLVGLRVSAQQNFLMGGFFTVVSLVRSYLLRRAFNRWHQSKSPIQTSGDNR